MYLYVCVFNNAPNNVMFATLSASKEEHFNKLNLKLQGNENTALYDIIYEQKLRVILEDISKNEFVFF